MFADLWDFIDKGFTKLFGESISKKLGPLWTKILDFVGGKPEKEQITEKQVWAKIRNRQAAELNEIFNGLRSEDFKGKDLKGMSDSRFLAQIFEWRNELVKGGHKKQLEALHAWTKTEGIPLPTLRAFKKKKLKMHAKSPAALLLAAETEASLPQLGLSLPTQGRSSKRGSTKGGTAAILGSIEDNTYQMIAYLKLIEKNTRPRGSGERRNNIDPVDNFLTMGES